MRHKDTLDKVEYLLKTYPGTLNDLGELYYRYNEKYMNKEKWYRTPFESIARARRALQYKHPSSIRVQQMKQKEQKNYLEQYSLKH